MAAAADRNPESGDLMAGTSLIVAALLSVLTMAHHPVSAHGGGIAGYVHGAMIALLAVLFYGFAHFAARRGLTRPAVLAGLTAYGVSLVANLGAGTINGFVVPALARRGPEAVSHEILFLCWEANQALAELGVFATGAAFALWSLDLLRGPAITQRLVGVAGLFAGIGPAAFLASGAVSMDVAGAFAVYALHAAWAVLIGFLLIRRRP